MTKMTTKNAFAVDFFNKAIIGTKAAFNKASKGEGSHYEELTRLMAQHPDFKLVIKEPKIHKEKKETYVGLTFDLMKAYIEIQANKDELLKAYEDVKKFAEDAKMSTYPITKKWFLDTFKDFNVNKAEKAIYEAKATAVVAKVTVKAKPSAPLTLLSASNQ